MHPEPKSRIAVLGGTGKEGSGLALRWASAGHHIVIGSRSRERAQETAAAINTRVGVERAEGADNLAAARSGEIVVMTVPYAAANPEFLVGKINLFNDNRKAHGYKAAAEVLGVYHFYCGETPEKAKEEPRDAVMRYVGAAAAANQEAAYSDQYTIYQGLKNAFQAMDYDYLYPSRVIFGDPDQCIERIKQVLAVGVTNVSLLVNFGGLDHGKIMASLDRFAKYVLPKFQ